MNLFIKLAAMSCLAASALCAAEAKGQSFGIYGGAGITDFDGSDVKNVESSFGFSAGVMTDISIANNISFAPHTLLSYRSAQSDNDDNGSLEISEMNVDVPLILRVHLPEGGYLGVGPFLSLNLSSNTSITLEAEDEELSLDFDNSSRETVYYGITANIGYNVSAELAVDLRLDYGLSDITIMNMMDVAHTIEKERGESFSETDKEYFDIKFKANSFALTLGMSYLF